ncbi:ras-domain-containing protein [Trametes polyzona]|nr:ras-domain-containing protein [Trametes polyzona]
MARSGRSISRKSGSSQRYSMVVLGAGGVGKSALIVRYGKNTFLDRYDPTVEEEYEVTVEYEEKRSHAHTAQCDAIRRRTKLQIIDTAGVEQFTDINESYIENGQGFVLVFSLTQEATLKDVDHIRQQIYRIKGGEQDIPIVVVGTKMDLTGEREVSSETMQELAVKWSLPIYETSAKKGWHVNEVFNHLLSRMRKRYPNGVPKSEKHRREQCLIM